MINFKALPFEDVTTDDFVGGEVTLRVNAETIEHYSRKVQIYKLIEEMEFASKDEEHPYYVAAGLMAIITNANSGGYAFEPHQITAFVKGVSEELFTALSVADYKVNPAKFANVKAEHKSLDAKKKST